MKRALLVLCMASGFALSACVSAPTASEAATADYGTPISQADAEQMAQTYIATRLKDPSSATYSWQPITKGWREGSKITGTSVIYGYRLDGSVNAKNSFGGYTGPKAYSVLFRNGRIAAVYAEQTLTGGASYMGQIL